MEARLEKGLALGCSLIFLRWNTFGKGHRDAVLFSDASSADALRRVRARLGETS